MAREQVTFWRDAALLNMEVLKATYVTHAFSRHTHEGYAIGTIESGIEAFEYLGCTYTAPAGTLVIIHPDEVHTGHAAAEEGWQYRMVYPAVDLMQEAAAELGYTADQVPFFTHPVVRDRLLVQQFRQFHQASETGDSLLARESQLLWLMSRMICRHGELRSPWPKLQRDRKATEQIRDYLHGCYANAITLDDLSQIVNLSPLKLLRLFSRDWGLPPHRYLVQIRVQQAKRLIARGLPLSAVAADTGFADQSHLNRHFKRLVGVTPGQYQRGC